MRLHTALLVGSLGLITAAPALGVTWTQGNIDNGSASDAFGQNFVIGLEPSADPGLVEGDAVSIDSISFYAGGGGTGAAETYLVLTDGGWFDWNGEDGTYVPMVGDPGFLGISTNAFDLTSASFGDELNFSFSSALTTMGAGVSAVFATISDDVITPIGASVAYIRYEETIPGVLWEPVANYGGANNYDAVAMFEDYSDDETEADGYLEGADDTSDLSFQVTLSEPAAGILGDYNGDSLVDADDIDLLTAAIRGGSADTQYDLDGSGAVDAGDLSEMIAAVIGTNFGDADLNGSVDLLDLSALASNFQSTGGWSQGNFNTDDVVDLLDLSALATNFGTTTAAPEPLSIAVLGLGAAALIRR